MLTFTGFVAEHYLTELLTSPLPYRWVLRGTERLQTWLAEFKTPAGQTYQVRFQIFADAPELDAAQTWKFIFMNMDPSVRNQWKQFDILGTGESIPIFATVAAILRDFTQRVHPVYIEFSAEERSRIKLYDRFIRMIQQQNLLPNYTARNDGQGNYRIMRR